MNYFKLYACCIPVKGAKRSVISDLQRNIVVFIPNILFELLTIYEKNSVAEIKSIFENQHNETIDEYFAFLEKEELGFFTNEPNLFPNLDLTWKSPKQITNAIIDFDNQSNHKVKDLFEQLSELGTEAVQLRFYSQKSLATLENILQQADLTGIQSLEIIIPFSEELTIQVLKQFCAVIPRLCLIIIYGATTDEEITLNSEIFIVFSSKTIENHSFCGKINPYNFSINIKTFTEAQQHNSCLNRKISIDVNGDIKNCPSLPQSFGNIAEVSLQNALLHKNFKDLWLINKDQIEVCKDCEFRYICTDCRAFITNPEDKYSKPSKCSYNPYIAEWEN
jgi:SPASM domain peptide maturase of grasp-with-spasm system